MTKEDNQTPGFTIFRQSSMAPKKIPVPSIHSEEEVLEDGEDIDGGGVRLMRLSNEGDLEGIKELLDSGIDANYRDVDDRTALHVASCHGFKDVVELLLDRKAEVDPKDRWGSTPLADAIFYNNIDVIKILEIHEAKHRITPMHLKTAPEVPPDSRDFLNPLEIHGAGTKHPMALMHLKTAPEVPLDSRDFLNPLVIHGAGTKHQMTPMHLKTAPEVRPDSRAFLNPLEMHKAGTKHPYEFLLKSPEVVEFSNPSISQHAHQVRSPDLESSHSHRPEESRNRSVMLGNSELPVFEEDRECDLRARFTLEEPESKDSRPLSELILCLPSDLVETILKKLPVKSLVRFQVISRGWATLFRETRFIYAHLKNQSNPSFLHSRDSSEIWMLDLGTANPHRYFLLRDFKGEHIKNISECDGLMIFNTISGKVAIWNCNLGPCAWLGRESLSQSDWYCLGHNSSLEYRVLRFTVVGCEDQEGDYHGPEAEVYNLYTHKWKVVAMSKDWGLYRKKLSAVSVEGNSYWLAWFEEDGVCFVQSFDFSKELFLPIKLPFRGKLCDKTTAALSCFKGERLALLYQKHREHTELWVSNSLKYQNPISSWEKMFTLTSPHPLIPSAPSYFIKENKITIFFEEVRDDVAQIKLMNISQHGVEETEIQRYSPSKNCFPSQRCFYVQSMVPPP